MTSVESRHLARDEDSFTMLKLFKSTQWCCRSSRTCTLFTLSWIRMMLLNIRWDGFKRLDFTCGSATASSNTGSCKQEARIRTYTVHWTHQGGIRAEISKHVPAHWLKNVRHDVFHVPIGKVFCMLFGMRSFTRWTRNCKSSRACCSWRKLHALACPSDELFGIHETQAEAI